MHLQPAPPAAHRYGRYGLTTVAVGSHSGATAGLMTRREKGSQEQEGKGAETKGTSKRVEKEGWDGRGEAGDGCRINDIEELVANLRSRLRAAPSNFVNRCQS